MRLPEPGVAAREGDASVGEPGGELDSRPGLAGEVGLAVLPVRAPAGVEEDGVTGLGLEIAEVVDVDNVAALEPLRLARSRHVDEPSPRHDLRDRLDTEVRRAGGARELTYRPAVVAALAHLEMAERVEVRAELHRPGDDLGHPVHRVLAHGVDRVGVVRGRDQRLPEVAAGKHGDRLVEHPAEVVEAAVTYGGQRRQALGFVDVIEHPDFVVGAERGRPPCRACFLERGHSEDHGSRKSAYSVSPPSTNSVWPVT